jgi:hypothetical protein
MYVPQNSTHNCLLLFLSNQHQQGHRIKREDEENREILFLEDNANRYW